AAEAKARRAIMANPDATRFYLSLANALVMEGGSLEAVRELYRQKHARIENAEARKEEEARDEASLALLAGDFAAAEEHAARYESLTASARAVGAHAWPARRKVEAALESGAIASASATASAFLARRDAWELDARAEDWAISEDPTGFFLWTMQH